MLKRIKKKSISLSLVLLMALSTLGVSGQAKELKLNASLTNEKTAISNIVAQKNPFDRLKVTGSRVKSNVGNSDLTQFSTADPYATNWAGYYRQATSYGVFGYLTVPDIINTTSSTLPAEYSSWVGLGGTGSAPLLQNGILCQVDANGYKQYRPWYEMINAGSGVSNIVHYRDSDFHCKPGDTVYIYTILANVYDRGDGYINCTAYFSWQNRTTPSEDYTESYPLTISKSVLSSSEWVTETRTGAGYHRAAPYEPTLSSWYNGNFINFQHCSYQTAAGGSFAEINNNTGSLHSSYSQGYEVISGSQRLVKITPDSIGTTGNFNNVYTVN